MSEVSDVTNELANSLLMLLKSAKGQTITEDQVPGGIEGHATAIAALQAAGHDVRIPKDQRNLNTDYPECRGRVIQLVS